MTDHSFEIAQQRASLKVLAQGNKDVLDALKRFAEAIKHSGLNSDEVSEAEAAFKEILRPHAERFKGAMDQMGITSFVMGDMQTDDDLSVEALANVVYLLHDSGGLDLLIDEIENPKEEKVSYSVRLDDDPTPGKTKH